MNTLKNNSLSQSKLHFALLQLHYDIDLFSIYFDEFKMDASGYSANTMLGDNTTNYIVLYDNEEQKNQSYFKVSHLRAMRKDDVIDLVNKYNPHIITELYTKADLIDILMTFTVEEYYQWIHENHDIWRDMPYDAYDIILRGYSQGDAIMVKYHGKETEARWSREALTHIFYDCPLSGKVTINDKVDIYFDNFLYDAYVMWDEEEKNELIESIHKAYKDEDWANELVAFLQRELPNSYEQLETW